MPQTCKEITIKSDHQFKIIKNLLEKCFINKTIDQDEQETLINLMQKRV